MTTNTPDYLLTAALIQKKQNKESVRDQLADLDCDPLAFQAKVMRGDKVLDEHPFLRIIRTFVRRHLEGRTTKKEALTMLRRAEHHLAKHEAPLELRLKVASDLMGYAYAKKKSVEVTGKIDLAVSDPLALTDAELAAIARGSIEGVLEYPIEEAELVATPELEYSDLLAESETVVLPKKFKPPKLKAGDYIKPSWLK